jgi:uncharacterized membrane protein HdeD (DUF308 family)
MSFETKSSPWWLLLMMGILNVIVGVLLLVSPVRTVVAAVWVLGLFWLVEGILILVGMFVDRTAWGWKLLMGVISIIAGLTIMSYPILSAAVIPAILILVMGVQSVIVGAIALVMAFKGGGWGAGILGALSVFFGIILVLNFSNLGTILAFIWILAVLAIAGGVAQIFQAFRQR